MQDASEQRISHRGWLLSRALPLTGAALLLRFLILLAVVHAKPSSWFYSQASELGEVAHSFATGHGLSSPFGGGTGASAFLPPGYPLLVGELFKLLGSYSRGAEVTLLVLQAVFNGAAVLSLMLIAERTFGQRTGLIAGLLLALDPWLISLGFVFWDTSFSLMMLTTLVLVTQLWIERSSSKLAYTAAVLGALGIAVNASLALTVVGLFAWAGYRRPDARRCALVPCALFILLCSIWPARNALTLHAFIPLRDNLGYELWQGNRLGADGFFDPELHPNINRSEFNEFRSLGELAYMREKSALARHAIEAEPVRFLWLTAKRVGYFWFGITRQRYTNQICIGTLTTSLATLGFILFTRRKGYLNVMPVLIPLILFPLPYYLTHPDFRFWCLLSPLLTASAVYLFAYRGSPNPA